MFLTQLYWHDIVEILFFVGVVDFISAWLNRNSRHFLLGYFYAYCTLIYLAYTFQLTTIHSFLFFASPCVALLFIIFHQHTLQKNLITSKPTITTHQLGPDQWIDAVIQASLRALNQAVTVQFIIEHTDTIDVLLNYKTAVNGYISTHLLDLIITNSQYDTHSFLVINTSGLLVYIDAQLSNNRETSPSVEQQLETARLITTSANILVLNTTKTRTFELAVLGKTHTNLNPQTAGILIKKWLGQLPKISHERSGAVHDLIHQTDRQKSTHA